MQRGARAAALPSKPVSEHVDRGAGGTRDRGRPRRIANIPHIQHARPQNAAREPDTRAQLFCIVRSLLAHEL